MGSRKRQKAAPADLATATGFSERTIRDYLARGWDGDPTNLDAWRRENLRRRGSRSALPRMDRQTPEELEGDADRAAGSTSPDWSAEYRRVKTLQALLELKHRQGELIRRDEVDRLFLARVSEVRAGLLLIPRTVARRLAHQSAEVVEEELEAEVRKLLERFARGDPILEGKTRKRGKGSRA